MGVRIEEFSVNEVCRLVREGGVWSSESLFVVGDIGGTNARLGFGRRSKDSQVHIVFSRFAMTKKDITQVLDFFELLIAKITPERLQGRVVSAGLSVPGPVSNGGKQAGPFNNLKGQLHLCQCPELLFPDCKQETCRRSCLMNDLEAGAHGILAASESHSFGDFFRPMWKGSSWDTMMPNTAVSSELGYGSCMVLAPGTGLGTSLIVFNAKTRSFLVIPLEFGSVRTSVLFGDIVVPDFTGKCNAGNVSVNHHRYLKKLACALGDAGDVPNAEQTCAGGVLEFNLRFFQQLLGQKEEKLSAKTIAERAIGRADPAASYALALTYFFLFSTSGDAVMEFLPLTCVLIGDNVVKNSEFLCRPDVKGWLRDNAVFQHPMEKNFKFLSRTTYLCQKKNLNLNILGCMRAGQALVESSKL